MSKAYSTLSYLIFPLESDGETSISTESRLDGIDIAINKSEEESHSIFIRPEEARQLAKHLNLLADHQDQELNDAKG